MINDPPRAHSTYVNNHPICMFISPLSWESSRSVEFHWKFRRNFSLVWHNNSNGRSSTAVPSIAAVPLSAVASCPRHGPPMSPPNEPYTHTRPLECSFPILHAAKSPRWDFSVPRQKKIQFRRKRLSLTFSSHCLTYNNESWTFRSKFERRTPLSPAAPTSHEGNLFQFKPLLFGAWIGRQLERDRSLSPPLGPLTR